MNNAVLIGILAVGLAACTDDEIYPGCENNAECDFSVTSWNQGSSNFWIYGEDPAAFYFYDGSLIGKEYLTTPRKAAETCTGFDRHDVLTWAQCGTVPKFTCPFIQMAKEVYDIRSSATAGKSGKYQPVSLGQYSCDI